MMTIHSIQNFGKKAFGLLFACGTLAACSLDIPYENQYSDPDAITTPEVARELLASAYYELPLSEFDLSVLSDDFETTYLISNNATLKNLYNWQPQPITDLGYTLWQSYYSAIAIANALMERTGNITVSTSEEEQELQHVVSEAKILKAYCYFNLLRLFAPTYSDGPDKDGIILKDEFKLASLKRSSISECVSAIRNLLTDAVKTENNPSNDYWFSQQSGYYLLAELELYAQNYTAAESYAKAVVEKNGGYDVLGSNAYSNLFSNSACAERLFSLYTTISYYSDMNYDSSKGDYMTVNSSLAGLYTEGDIRKEETIYPFDMPGQTVGEIIPSDYLGKYSKRVNWLSEEVNYVNKFRVSGACFILAEAYCLDGNGNEGEARTVLNNYLTQRGAQTVDDNVTGDELLKTVLTEKWKEFVGEGERYFDLKRYRKTVLADWNSGTLKNEKRVEKDDYRWTLPLPTGEYLYNENVSQNEGWEEIEN